MEQNAHILRAAAKIASLDSAPKSGRFVELKIGSAQNGASPDPDIAPIHGVNHRKPPNFISFNLDIARVHQPKLPPILDNATTSGPKPVCRTAGLLLQKPRNCNRGGSPWSCHSDSFGISLLRSGAKQPTTKNPVCPLTTVDPEYERRKGTRLFRLCSFAERLKPTCLRNQPRRPSLEFSLHTDSSDTEETEVTVAYSNPIYGNLPNAISFHFPIVSSYRLLNRQESTFVCLHPDLAESGDQGRYFEDGDVKRDCLYDCDVFWTPIASTLRRARCREEQA